MLLCPCAFSIRFLRPRPFSHEPGELFPRVSSCGSRGKRSKLCANMRLTRPLPIFTSDVPLEIPKRGGRAVIGNASTSDVDKTKRIARVPKRQWLLVATLTNRGGQRVGVAVLLENNLYFRLPHRKKRPPQSAHPDRSHGKVRDPTPRSPPQRPLPPGLAPAFVLPQLTPVCLAVLLGVVHADRRQPLSDRVGGLVHRQDTLACRRRRQAGPVEHDTQEKKKTGRDRMRKIKTGSGKVAAHTREEPTYAKWTRHGLGTSIRDRPRLIFLDRVFGT